MDKNEYIKKSHLRMVERFNEDLEAFRKETGDSEAVLYENIFTGFTLSNVRVENGELRYSYDGHEDAELVVRVDEETGECYEDEVLGIAYTIGFWRACLRRAKRYWGMSGDQLDDISDGLRKDIED